MTLDGALRKGRLLAQGDALSGAEIAPLRREVEALGEQLLREIGRVLDRAMRREGAPDSLAMLWREYSSIRALVAVRDKVD